MFNLGIWVTLGQCIAYITLAIGLLGAVAALGWCVLGGWRQGRKAIPLFERCMAGLVFAVGLYATVKMGGNTILLLLPAIAIVYGLLPRPTLDITARPSVRNAMLVGITACGAYFLYFLQSFASFNPETLRYPAGDYLFYSRLVHYVNTLGIENPRLDYLYPTRFGAEAYHWGDIWLGGLINGVFRVDYHHALLLVGYPLLCALFAMGVHQYLGTIFKNNAHLKARIGIAVVAALLSGLPLLYPAALYKPYIFDASLAYYPKLMWPACGIVWALLELRQGTTNRFLVICAAISLSFVNVLPTMFGAAAVLCAYRILITRSLRWRQVGVGAGAVMAVLIYFFLFYRSVGKGSESLYVSKGIALNGEFLKLAAGSIVKSLMQLMRLLPYLVVGGVIFFLSKQRLRWRKPLPPDVLFAMLLLVCGLGLYGAAAGISLDAMQGFQNVYMPLASLGPCVLLLWLWGKGKVAKIGVGILLLLNLVFNSRFSYQVDEVAKEDVQTAASFLSSNRAVFLNKDENPVPKWGLNTALNFPLPFMDYMRPPFINASLDIPFVQVSDAYDFQKEETDAIIRWAPFSHFRQQERQDFPRDAMMLRFVRAMGATDICAPEGRPLPFALQTVVQDSTVLPVSRLRLYRLR